METDMETPKVSMFRIVALNVSALRTKKGLSQVELARLAKVPCGAVRQAEAGDRSLRIHHLVSIVTALDTSMGRIFMAPEAAAALERVSRHIRGAGLPGSGALSAGKQHKEKS